MTEKTSWGLAEGDEIAPGRSVLKLLGGGTRYEALLVWDDHLFAIMVAKVLRPAYAQRESALRDLRKEADALALLAHPVIVRGYGAVLDGDYPHVLIEHLEGPTLRRVLRAERFLHMQQLLPLALHVASAIHYMSQEGWVHLDLKPDNLIMGVPPRVIDLSVARTVARAARTAGVVGTDRYMAPEQCGTEDWEGLMGPPADVWGLGATLWRAATGEVPFPRPKGAGESDDPDVRFPQLHADKPEPPRNMDPRLAELLHATLEKDPARRPTARQVAEALEPLVGALPRKAKWGRRG